MISQKNKIVMITWKDAAYTFEKEFPNNLPEIQTAVGFLIEDNPKFIKIANNAYIEQLDGKILPIDGFLIPQRTIIGIQTIDYEKN